MLLEEAMTALKEADEVEEIANNAGTVVAWTQVAGAYARAAKAFRKTQEAMTLAKNAKMVYLVSAETVGGRVLIAQANEMWARAMITGKEAKETASNAGTAAAWIQVAEAYARTAKAWRKTQKAMALAECPKNAEIAGKNVLRAKARARQARTRVEQELKKVMIVAA
jgi:predicted Ser/Thr protein kinase